jgi:MoxR-like ATPase
LFLSEISRIPGSRYLTGGSSSKAGISRFLIDVRPKILLIDEIDKMRCEDFSVLLSVMEDGTVSEMKFGRREHIKLKLWVFAAANDISRIPGEVKSRFLIFRLRKYDTGTFKRVVINILMKREGKDVKLAKYIAEKIVMLSRDPRDAIKIARLSNSKDEVIEILDTWKKFC